MAYKKRLDRPTYIIKRRGVSRRLKNSLRVGGSRSADPPKSRRSRSVSYRGELIPASTRKTAIDLVREFRRRGLKYVLAGAIPVQYYGRERFSRDVDIVVSLDERGAESLFEILKKDRYTLIYPMKHEREVKSPRDLLELGLVKIRDRETGSLADLILHPSEAGFKFDPESERRMRTVILNGEKVLIPSPEDYLIMKLKSRRPGTHDFEDIISTLSAQFDNLDWNYLNRRAEEERLTSLLNHYKEAVKRKMGRREP